jgi:hypothetical protein
LCEVAWLTIATHKITQGSSTLLYRRSEHLLNNVCKALVARQRNATSGTIRANSGLEQGFVSVNITNTNNDFSVHDEVLYRAFTAPREVIQKLAIKFR